MSRSASLLLSIAAGCLISGATLTARADTDSAIPAYFFKQWNVTKDCSTDDGVPTAHVVPGQKFEMSSTPSNLGGRAYRLKSLDSTNHVLTGAWGDVNLQYRPGTKMAAVPADFECVPGEESSSPFLALGDTYASNAEPYYEYEHWYALVTLHGQPHHLLIFPRNVSGQDTAIIVLQNAGDAEDVTLDGNGVIHTSD